MNKSAIPSAFSPSDMSHLQVIAQAVAAALHQLLHLRTSRRTASSLTSFARSVPHLVSCGAAPDIADYVGRTLCALVHARASRLVLMNNHNPDATTWRAAPSSDGTNEPLQQLRLPCKSLWSNALRSGKTTIVNDTRSDPRFGRDCSFGSIMLVPIYTDDAISDKDDFGTYVMKQGCTEHVNALGLIVIKDKLSNSGFTDIDAAVAENMSKAVAAALQREDVRRHMHDSSLEGRLILTGSFLQQVRQAEALIARQCGFERSFVFLSQNEMLSYEHSDGRISSVDPTVYPFNVCCNRLSVVAHPTALNQSSSIDWTAAIARIVLALHLDSIPHSIVVLPLLGGSIDSASSLPFGVAVCLQWAGTPKQVSPAVRDLTLSLTTSASLVLQSEIASITEKQRAAAYAATVDLGRQLQSAAVDQLVAREKAFSAATVSAPPPDAVPQEFLKSAQAFTAVACAAQLALIHIISSPPSGGDRLICVNSDGVVEGQPCGRGIVGNVYRSNSNFVVFSALDDRRFVSNIDTPTGIRVHNMVAVPLPCASNASMAGGVLALYNISSEMMHAAIAQQAARDSASVIANALTYLISGTASACMRYRLQGSISTLSSCLQRSLQLHANAELSDIVLRNGCASFEKMIPCDCINVYTIRPGVDVMFPFQLPHHGRSIAPSQVHFPIEGLVGQAARSGAVVVSTSPLDDARYSPGIDRCSSGRSPSSILCIPIMSHPEQSHALRSLAISSGHRYTFGSLERVVSDDPDSQMQVDLWLPPSFAGTLAPPDFSGLSLNDNNRDNGAVAVVELVLHARKKPQTFKSDDVIVAAAFASQLATAVRNSRQLMQIDTVTQYCHPMLSSLMADSPGKGKEQLHVLESLRRTALGLCRTQFAALFFRETSVGRDELVSVEWLSAVSGLTLSNLLASHPRLAKRFAPHLALREQELKQRIDQVADALKAGGLGTDPGSVPSVFDGVASGSAAKHDARGRNGPWDDDWDVPVRLRVPISVTHGGLVGTCAMRREVVVMQRQGQHPHFFPGIDDRHSLVTQNEVCAPICDCSGHVIAVLQLINHPGGFFSQEDLQAVKVFALIAAEALKEAEEASIYRKWLTFTRGVRKILQFSAIPESSDRDSSIWQACAITLAGMMQCVSYCFILCSYDERRWTRYSSCSAVVKDAKRSGLPSQCIRCGDIQLQDAMSRKYAAQSPSNPAAQCYIDLLSDGDEDVPKFESSGHAAAESSNAHSSSSGGAGDLAQEEQPDSSSAGASSSCGLLCVPLTDLHLGRGSALTTPLLCHS
jgi:GAF domain-containing protein